MNPKLLSTTLVGIDTTDRVEWTLRAMEKSMEQCFFGCVMLFTNRYDLKYSYKIPTINGLGEYSRFVIQELPKHISTSYALIVQYDGFVIRGEAWDENFRCYDYLGAKFNPSGIVGNGGFSFRTKRLMDFCAKQNWPDAHPEDSCICLRHRLEVEDAGFRFAPPEVAERFAVESRSWNSKEWQGTSNKYENQFGFHSLLTPLPPEHRVCNIYTHSGDAGDVIYSLAAVKALGGGMMFLTPHNKYPYPLNSRWSRMGGEAEWVDNLAPLVEAQPYILKCRYTHGHPASTTHDLNRFRIPWRNRTAKDFDSILKLHMEAFNLPMPSEPWLTISDPIVIEGKPIVVNRTARYQNWEWPWTRFIEKYHRQFVFVGTPQEYELFKGFAPTYKFDYYPTKDCLELARVIAGAKLFCGNQSLALAIAHGLYKKVMVEEWALNPNTRIERAGAIYGIPKELTA